MLSITNVTKRTKTRIYLVLDCFLKKWNKDLGEVSEYKEGHASAPFFVLSNLLSLIDFCY